MKYGQHLKDNIAPQYGEGPYLQYRRLDDIIREISAENSQSVISTNPKLSLSVSSNPTDSKGEDNLESKERCNEETFLSLLDQEMIKVERFTLSKVTDLRLSLSTLETSLLNNDIELDKESVKLETEVFAQDFLRLEKYVNINFMGFHKILKKHDKYIPLNPCKSFYINRMHNQSWVRGDYSDLVVRLSNIYAKIRDDKVSKEDDDGETRKFHRRTTKYWVKTEDVSRVKYQVLKHLPVFLQKTSTGETDSQLTNSVYLDNDHLELYHSRLDRKPGSVALRLRWYGTGEPSLVYVERKSHKDDGTSESSKKARFTVEESSIKDIMTDQFDIAKIKKEMENTEALSFSQVDEWETVAKKVTQVIGSKQLVPTLRTQYMRTAFQIPFDASVRISLDTNITMISERGYNLENGKVWHRKPSNPPSANEINRFPHAVLEIKLELDNEVLEMPVWVEELQSSGMLNEMHKFSKFLHGCATLLSEDVRRVPYWVDDISLKDSITACGADRILAREGDSEDASITKSDYDHLLPFGTVADNKINRKIGWVSSTISTISPRKEIKKKPNNIIPIYDENDVVEFGKTSVEEDEEEEEEDFEDLYDNNRMRSWPCLQSLFCPTTLEQTNFAPSSIQKTEPTLLFANERTFLHWLHNGVILSCLSSIILSFSGEDSEHSLWYAIILTLISSGFCIYALNILIWRSERIKSRIPGRWDDPRGPILLGGFFIAVLLVALFVKVNDFLKLAYEGGMDPQDDDFD